MTPRGLLRATRPSERDASAGAGVTRSSITCACCRDIVLARTTGDARANVDDRLEPSLDGAGIPGLEGPLPEKAATGDAQEGIYRPQDDYVGAHTHGVTGARA